MKKILFIVTILLVLLGAIVAWQTFQFRGRQMVVTPASRRKLDAERITSRLAGALQFRTVSHEDRSRIDYNEFTSLEAYLEKTFPALHSRLQKEVIGNHSLLFREPSLMVTSGGVALWMIRETFPNSIVTPSLERLLI